MAFDPIAIDADGSRTFTADQSMGGFKLTSLAAPTVGGDAANKTYVDNTSQLQTVSAQSANFTAATEDAFLVDATGGAVVATLPAAASNNGKVYYIKKIDSSANTVTVNPNAAELIDGAATYVLSTQWASIVIICDGTDWFIF